MRIFGTLAMGDFAVYSFFILSGFLLAGSWQSQPDLVQFLRRRILRIVPGFLACVVLCLLFFGPMASPKFYGSFTVEHLLGELATLRFRIGAFYENPVADLNRPLWTIHYEFVCYLMMAATAAIGLLRTKEQAGLLFLAFAMVHIAQVAFDGYLPGAWLAEYVRFATYFFAGALLHFTRLTLSPAMLAMCAVALIASLFHKVTMIGGIALAWPVLIYAIGSKPSRLSCWIGSTDISYGLYLYAWPVHQFVFLKVTSNLWLGLLLTVAFSVALGFLSWRLVEYPALRLKQSGSWPSLNLWTRSNS